MKNMSIAAGSSHSLAIAENGVVFGCGLSTDGELGRGNTRHQLRPVQIEELRRIFFIANGYLHNLAIARDGTVSAWGRNSEGQLGIGNTTNQLRPVEVEGLPHVISVSASKHDLALTKGGRVFAWGRNNEGQLGIGNTTDQLRPVQVKRLRDIVSVAAGGKHSLAVARDGTVFSWGENMFRALGRFEECARCRSKPVKIGGLQNIASVAASSNSNLALTIDGYVLAWGYNGYGVLGTGNEKNQPSPVRIEGLRNIDSIAIGGGHSFAVDKDGTVYAWGANYYGQLGIGYESYFKARPVRIDYLQDIVFVAAGSHHSLAVAKDGSVYACGYNAGNRLGNDNRKPQLKFTKIQGIPPCLVSGSSVTLAVEEVLSAADVTADTLKHNTTITSIDETRGRQHAGDEEGFMGGSRQHRPHSVGIFRPSAAATETPKAVIPELSKELVVNNLKTQIQQGDMQLAKACFQLGMQHGYFGVEEQTLYKIQLMKLQLNEWTEKLQSVMLDNKIPLPDKQFLSGIIQNSIQQWTLQISRSESVKVGDASTANEDNSITTSSTNVTQLQRSLESDDEEDAIRMEMS